ncbi:TetR/AcrR family transcriptional regulator [Bacteroidales bacterium OttesenSCG-928-C03]|nr:TetR/AcrR family transcriptional regulator [Bacteroidales bacterium OttesenSCG-928-E04]MDL2308436.1 TetR/AcrR family transcriptional regulator [Bacteroidales bacterium OttesenSCG-928-C03]MDL2326400.1 TetR/AcrR family transcriptional regulator [Bacteroidales bacterium OttesenSCG-928-A14]
MKNTTMNDIAVLSKKGRRTLYTYFKNKNEILDAIISEELDCVVRTISEVMEKEMDPIDKFVAYIVTRMNVMREVVQRNGSLGADFFKDVIRVELCRRKLERIEIDHLKTILQEGRQKGVFNFSNIDQVAIFTHFVIRGIDVPYIRGVFDEPGPDKNETLKRKTLTILHGLLNSEEGGGRIIIVSSDLKV